MIHRERAEWEADQTGVDPRLAQRLRFLKIALDLKVGGNLAAKIGRAHAQETIAMHLDLQFPIGEWLVRHAEIRWPAQWFRSARGHQRLQVLKE